MSRRCSCRSFCASFCNIILKYGDALSGFLDSAFCILSSESGRTPEKEDVTMKGYYNNSGYMGYVDGRWVLFASEGDYQEYMEE